MDLPTYDPEPPTYDPESDPRSNQYTARLVAATGTAGAEISKSSVFVPDAAEPPAAPRHMLPRSIQLDSVLLDATAAEPSAPAESAEPSTTEYFHPDGDALKQAIDEKTAAENSSSAADGCHQQAGGKKDMKTIRCSNPIIRFVHGEESPEPVRRHRNTVAPEKKVAKPIYITEEHATEFRETVAEMAEEHTPLKAQDTKVLAANMHHMNEAMSRLHRTQGYTSGMMEKTPDEHTQVGNGRTV